MAIDLCNDIISNSNSRHLRVKIRIHYHKEDTTLLRREIVELVSTLISTRLNEIQRTIASTSK